MAPLGVGEQVGIAFSGLRRRLRAGFNRSRRGQTGERLLFGEEAILGEDADALDRVAQLAHVAGPGRRQQQAFGRGSGPENRLVELRRKVANEGAVRNGMSSRRSRSGVTPISTTLSR